ncbi:hypothetical protein Ahy_A03g015079 [Arachis hypogaea]|uniref:Uncharacterized protein n=1 Tax=Arachis hypogaea TaxID=3818 RepID=A0A445DZU1_ARAHY|nr:hypothetical protein Ahy_A03g015079 [Arachis hypogaea]
MPYPNLKKKNLDHRAVKAQFQKKTTTQLRNFVYSCPMDTDAQRADFRRHFILVVLKIFLCPTSQQTISPWNIPPILDVTNPSRFNWAHKTFKWLGLAIEKFQSKNHETCGGCMFTLLRLQHGPLDHCREKEPWVIAWTAAELEKKAANVLAEGYIGERKRGSKESASTKQSKWRAPKNRVAHKARTGTRKMLPIIRGRSRDNSTAAHEGPSCNERHVVPSDSDKNDDVPIAQRRRRPIVPSDSDDDDDVPIAHRRRRLFQDNLNPNGENVNEEFDVNFVQCLEVEKLLEKFEQGGNTSPINMEPLQVVVANKSCYHTPSPGRHSFSLGLTQLENSPATPPS